jgi:Cof subfamily protein (haloacid dehalogenase superfamily)
MREQAPAALPHAAPAPHAERVVPRPQLNGWRPRLVATDLDGTLLDSSGCVTPRTRAALEACWREGIPVIGVTGRGPRLLDSVRGALAGRGIAVLAQGGYVVDLERDEVLRTIGLPRSQAQAVIERIESVAGDLVVAVEDAAEQAEARRAPPLRVQHGFDWPYPEPAHLLPKHQVLPPGPVLKVFLRSPGLDQDELLALARRVVEPAEAEVTHAGLGFIEVLPPGITKATGLAVALERYGVGWGDLLAFGDMPNDVPMLTAVLEAGGRAVGVANAHLAVRALVPELTSGHDADGVAQYLEAVLDV